MKTTEIPINFCIANKSSNNGFLNVILISRKFWNTFFGARACVCVRAIYMFLKANISRVKIEESEFFAIPYDIE